MSISSRAALASTAVLLAAVVAPLAARADAPLPLPFHPHPGALALSAARNVYVPVDGDVSTARTLHAAVLTPIGSDPARETPVESHPSARTGDPRVPPFLCIGEDQCEFTRLPFYDQGNPNFAHVDVPTSTYDHEKYPVPGSLELNPRTGKWQFVITNGPADPFFASWLPFGPLPGDPGAIPGNYWATSICAPTAISMSLMGALAARASTTEIIPGSWVDTSFVKAQKPAGQAALPSPLVDDHDSVAPGNAQMTAADIQRVINTAEFLGIDPTSGGYATFANIAHDFRYSDRAHPRQVVWQDDDAHALTGTHLANLLKDRYSTVIGIHPFIAHLTPLEKRGMTVTKWKLTFTANGGHVMAISGFSGGTAHPTFTIYDPVYAAVIQRPLVEIGSTNVTKDGVPVEVHFPGGWNGVEQVLAYDSSPAPAHTGAIADGQSIVFVDEYHAMKLE